MSAVITSVSVVPANLTPCGDELVAQLGGVDEVAVVPEGDHVAVAAAHQRLRVLPVARAGGGVAHVADGVLAAEAREHLLVEHLADEAQVLDDRDLAVVAHGDAGALLAAVLQGVEAEEGQARDVAPRRVDAEDATAVVEAIVVHGLTSGRSVRAAAEATRKQNGARPPGRRRAPRPPWYTSDRVPVTRPSDAVRQLAEHARPAGRAARARR